MSRPKRCFRIHVVIFAVISCCIMVVPVALLAFPLLDRYHEAPPPVAANLPDFSVGPADWRELYWLKNKPAPSREVDVQTDLSPEDLYDLVAPSVVTINVKDENKEPIGSGSGFFVDEALLGERYEWLDSDREPARLHNEDGSPTQHGYVLTNYHVIRPAVYADILLFNGNKGTVLHVVGEDEIADLALLSVNVSSERPLQTIPLATSNPRILSTVYAIGSPKGLEGSASQGKVSAYRSLSGHDFWLQTTAPISHGSSGGPLVSPEGWLVGVTTLGHKEGQNLNFAVPASIVRSFFLATNFNLRRRDVAEGASIQWQEDKAFLQVQAAAASPRFTEAQRDALEMLDEARTLLLGNVIQENRQDQVGRYHLVISLANNAYMSLPDEFHYLAHYIAGKSYRGLAWEATRHYWASTNDFAEALVLRRDSKDFRVALENFLQVTLLNPNFSPGWWELAIHGNITESERLQALDTLAKLMPRCAEVLGMHAQQQQSEAAVRGMRVALELSPRNWGLHYKLAMMLSNLGEHVEAISSYETAVTLSDSQNMKNMFQYEIGISHMKSGNMDKAILAFTKAKTMGFLAIMCDTRIDECTQRQH